MNMLLLLFVLALWLCLEAIDERRDREAERLHREAQRGAADRERQKCAGSADDGTVRP